MNPKLLLLATVALFATGTLVYLNHSQTKNGFLDNSINDTVVYDAFSHWKNKHGVMFESSEDNTRFQTFKANFIKVTEHNEKFRKGEKTYDLDLNAFAASTVEEYKKYLGLIPSKNHGLNTQVLSTEDLPASYDWREHNAVTPVKNQGQCGSCWAFSTTGSVEGVQAIKTGKIESFSEQQLVDCSGSYGNLGCNGGLMDSAFKYVEAKGLELEESYPYEAETETCNYNKSLEVFSVSSFVDVPANSESSLRAAVAKNPVSVAIDAECNDFMLYKSGVFTTDCGTGLDHGVLAVGYGSENGQDYWIVKNSWGSTWGEQGYIRMLRTSGNTPGMCGIQMQASYPVA